MTKRSFGELELAILRVLKSGERMTVKQVHTLLGEQNKYNTIMTVMLRLAEKKTLARERVGQHYEYWLLPSKSKVPVFIEHLKKKIFGVRTIEMMSYLIEASDDISDADLIEMEKLINHAKIKRERHNKDPREEPKK